MAGQARCGWPVPPSLEHRLTLVDSQACAAAGHIRAALAAAERAGRDDSLEAAVTLAHAWVAAGDDNQARHALAPSLAAGSGAPERVRLQARLVDAQLSYNSGDRTRGRRSLASALRLGEREQLRLPFALERTWLRLVLRPDPELAPAPRPPPRPPPATPRVSPAPPATPPPLS